MSSPLVIRFATDAEGAKNAIAGLAGSIASNMVTAGTAIKAVNDNVDKIGNGLGLMRSAAGAALPALLAYGAAVAVFATIGAAIDAAKEKVAELNKVAEQSRQAGVGSTFFQAFTQGARDAELKTEDLIAALNRAREASTVRLGHGEEASGSEVGRRIGGHVDAGNLGAADAAAYNGATNQEQRIRVVLDLVEKLLAGGRELAAFDLAGKMFGPKFEAALRNGTDMVGRLRAELDKPTGKILDEGEVGRAERLTQRLDDAQRIMTSALKPVYDDLARLGTNHYESWVSITERMAAAVQWAGSLYSDLKRIPGVLEQAGNAPFWDKVYLWMKARGLAAELPKADPLGKPSGGVEAIDPADKPMLSAVEQLRRGLQNGGAVRNAQAESLDLARAVRPDKSKPIPKPQTAGGDDDSPDAVERLIKQLEKANEVAKAELETVGKTNVEREKAVALAKAHQAAKEEGRSLTAEEVANVTRLAEETAKAKDAQADLNQQLRQNAETLRYFGDTALNALGSFIFDGQKAGDVAKNLAVQIGKAALQAALMGSGPLAGLFGTAAPASAGPNAIGGLAGLLRALLPGGGGLPTMAQGGMGPDIPVGLPGRANGGRAAGGRAIRVGEMGEEVFVPGEDGRVYPIGRGALGGGGVQLQVNNYTGAEVTPRMTGDGLSLDIGKMADQALAERVGAGRGATARAIKARASGAFLKG